MVICSSVPFLLGIPSGWHQHARSIDNKKQKRIPRVVNVFYGEIYTKAVLGHLVFICLSSKLAKLAGAVGLGLTANPNS